MVGSLIPMVTLVLDSVWGFTSFPLLSGPNWSIGLFAISSELIPTVGQSEYQNTCLAVLRISTTGYQTES